MLRSAHKIDNSMPSELHSILQLSLKSSDYLGETLQAALLPRPSNEQLRKIVAAILWHRKFVLTYYAVIGFIVTISCCRRIHHIFQRKNKDVQDHGINIPGFSATLPSSAASAISNLTTSPHRGPRDRSAVTSPLLSLGAVRTPSRLRPLDLMKSFLIYQPRDVWALTSPSNVLPDNGTSLVIGFLFVVNLFYLFFHAPLSVRYIFILADRAGLMFVVNLPVLYVLAAKNNQPLEFLTGWSYEALNIFHRRLGEWMTSLSIIHTVGMFTVWYTIQRERGLSLLLYLSHSVVFLGIATILSYLTIYITSIGWFRRLYYETFLGLHVLFQFGALGFLYLHYPTSRPFVIASLGIWAIDRLLWRAFLSIRTYMATLEVASDGQTILLHCDINIQHKPFGIHMGVHHGWLPGQHVFLTIPSMGFKYRFQTHPFTIASPAPPGNANINSWPLRLVIRSIAGFSKDLLEYALQHRHCEVILEGPHGGTDVLQAAHDSDRVCFVAGGSGIAVTYPLAWDICVEDKSKESALVITQNVSRDASTTVKSLLSCGVSSNPEYAHLWVRQEACHESWLTFFPRAASIKERYSAPTFCMASSTNEALEDVANIVTQTFDTRSGGHSAGRPDIASELWSWVTSSTFTRSSSTTPLSSTGSSTSSASYGKTYKTFHETKHSDLALPKKKICIIVSGPDGLVHDVRNISSRLVRDGWDIQVWVEKFGW